MKRTAYLTFFYKRLFSLTPCFSWVLPENLVSVNRFNGFEGKHRRTSVESQIAAAVLKPLKRLKMASSLLNTQLKQGVNEMGGGRKNLKCAQQGTIIAFATACLLVSRHAAAQQEIQVQKDIE